MNEEEIKCDEDKKKQQKRSVKNALNQFLDIKLRTQAQQ